MKKLFLLLSIIIIFSACNNNDEPEKVSRTVLVYMVADNTLTDVVEANVGSMMAGLKATSNADNLIIYLDDFNKTPVLYKLKKSNDGSVTKEVIKNYSEQNSLDVSVMKGILSEVYSSYPADSYGLILWSHGYSWVPSPSTKTVSTRWFGQDNSTKTQGDTDDYMDIPDLANALTVAPHLDFIMFDACLMSSVEVAYQLKDRADYLIATPTEVIDSGFPYKQIIEPMFSSQKNYTEMASRFYNYYNAMSGQYKSATIAVTKCSEMDNLATATKKIIAAHPLEFYTIVPGGIQLYDRVGSSDHFAYDFGNLIEDIATTEEWTNFQKQLNATVVYKATTDYFINLKIDPNHFSGLGAYIPQQSQTVYNAFFKTLSWYDAAGWDQTAWGSN
ncbi:clostripain-related cysteine peptidase [uncultured Bacteroides sp.]|uniref:clostripain-related cysteine peptidase n=1 Tax=uncultured Bacteroides sp. TaxID=162156 RepID=UPI002AABC156|nr:clostripain-related cysteine peptidase [uncultured Bacteroides sp.]